MHDSSPAILKENLDMATACRAFLAIQAALLGLMAFLIAGLSVASLREDKSL